MSEYEEKILNNIRGSSSVEIKDQYLPWVYEMLAEECSELACAALKYARILRGENPTDADKDSTYANLQEEAVDVNLVLDYLALTYFQGFPELYQKKIERWAQRIVENDNLRKRDEHDEVLEILFNAYRETTPSELTFHEFVDSIPRCGMRTSDGKYIYRVSDTDIVAIDFSQSGGNPED